MLRLLSCVVVSALLGCAAEPVTTDAAADATTDTRSCVGDVTCDDGVFCNGPEHCAAARCVAGTPPCVATACDEAMDRCTTSCTTDADGDHHLAMACGGDDCDDADSNRHPGNTEVCDPSHDEDCIASTLGFVDADGDGYGSSVCCNGTTCDQDCDDACPSCHPASVEACDMRDNDCDTAIDEDLTSGTYYADCDGDLYGAGPPTPTSSCAPPAGAPPGCALPGATWATNDTDCADAVAGTHPGATDTCNGNDDDCDGTADEGLSQTYYPDCDGDGYGDERAMGVMTCAPSACGGYPAVTSHTDCDDTAGAAHPGATERCDAADQNCMAGGYDTLVCGPPGSSGDCPVSCQTAPGSRSCSSACDWDTLCTPAQTTWSWTGADAAWGHGCGGGASGTVWCAQSNTECYLTFGNYHADLPPGQYTATWTVGVANYPGVNVNVVGHVQWIPSSGPPQMVPGGDQTVTFNSGSFPSGTVSVNFTLPADPAHRCLPVEFLFIDRGGSPTVCLHRLDVTWTGP